jgi:hypothetical protein
MLMLMMLCSSFSDSNTRGVALRTRTTIGGPNTLGGSVTLTILTYLWTVLSHNLAKFSMVFIFCEIM